MKSTKQMLLATVTGVILFMPFAAEAKEAEVTKDDIVVTAQRRSESLQSVPISVTALTGQQLAGAGVATTQDLMNVTPGLVWGRSSFNSQPTIRGIGNRNAGPGDEPNVAAYIDGVYLPQQSATLQELSDVERVEVLKGPQGTLFGRNATGGAVNIITKKPSFVPHGDFTVGVGEYQYRRGTAYLTGPIIADRLAVSISAVAVDDDGYIKNVFLNTTQGYRRTMMIRAKLLYTPNDNWEFGLNALTSKSRDNISFSGHALGGNAQARRTANPTNIPLNILIPTGAFQTATQFEPYDKVQLNIYDAHMSGDLGWATLTGLVSYARARIHTFSDTDISPLSINRGELFLHDEWSNEELVLSSKGDGRLSWLLGASAFQGNSQQDPNLSNGIPNWAGQRTRAASVFGELTYEVVDHLFLTGGLRYTSDKKIATNKPVTNIVTSGRATFTNTSPRLVARYEFNEETNVYASYTQGYKSGTFNPLTAAGAVTPAKPEKVKAYEVGVKTQLFPGFRATAAAFHYDYTDLQTTVINTVNGIVVSSLQNAPSARINGFEAGVTWRVDDHLRLSSGLSILDTKITDFTNASVVVPILVGGLPAGGSNVVRDVTGAELIRAPKSTFNMSATYDHELFGGNLTLTGSAFISAKYFIELTNRVAQPSYTLVNASATWTPRNSNFRFTVYGQNLTNDLINAAMISTSFADNVAYQKPRWFGFTVGYSF